MNHIKNHASESSHSNHSIAINGIQFTSRELDILSCMVSGRRIKTIAGFLSISPKTVETHIRNIMRKLECNSQESIINFLEKSDKFAEIKQLYLQILTKKAFAQSLYEIALLISKDVAMLVSIYAEDDEYSRALLHKLEEHFKSVGVTSTTKFTKPELTAAKAGKTLYIVSESLLNKLSEQDSPKSAEETKAPKIETTEGIVLFVGNATEDNSLNVASKINYVDFREHKNYYLSFFELLTKLFPTLNFDSTVTSFTQQQGVIQNSHRTGRLTKYVEDPLQGGMHLDTFIKKNESVFIATSIGLGILGVVVTIIMGNPFTKSPKSTPTAIVKSIRSDLPLPIETNLLQRPQLLEEIKEKLQGKKGIQTIAIIGIGGAGKTTLAHQYAHTQKSSVVWEINAETRESLLHSFENMAYGFAKNEEERKILRGLREIIDSNEREEKIRLYVKEQLRSRSGWLLIYDSVDKFSDIQTYFPSDSNVWGLGSVIITTRDSNIQNNSHVNYSIQIGELSQQQTLDLFIKILHSHNLYKLKEIQEKHTQQFLRQIPPFPLDVSIAAYYILATNISYSAYLKYLTHYNNAFVKAQEDLLKETGEYTRTRYGIIVSSLHRINAIHKDFSDLLLLISLLDSQRIPQELLITFKDPIVVDNFIYYLKKYSLITDEAYFTRGATFSIHRSTQEISLFYLIENLNLGKNHKLIQEISMTLESYINGIIDKEDFSAMKLLILHCEKFLRVDHLLDEHIKGAMESKLGVIYFYLGYYLKAKALLEKSLSRLTSYNQEDKNRLTWALGYLGDVYHDIGDYEKAKEVLEKALSTYKKYLPEAQDGIARTWERLGNVYEGMGNYEKATELLEESLFIYKKLKLTSGQARTLGRLENIYRDLGMFEKARDCDEESLMLYKKHFPQNQVRIARQLAGLGNIYRYLGNYGKAKHLLEESLAIYAKELPPDHIYTTWAFIFLGNIYKQLGEYGKAIELLEKNLLICEIHYGKDHIKVAEVLRELGEAYLLKNDIKRSESFLLKSLNICEKKLHSTCYTFLESLGDLYIKKLMDAKNKQPPEQIQIIQEQAAHYLNRALKIIENNFPKNSPHLYRVREKLINLQKKKKIIKKE